MILKRRTSQNIVWGGIAGCMPVLIGWSAVTDSSRWAALILFLVIFFWTPPHYWPLSMKFKEDYARAGVPMLPVVAADKGSPREIVALQLAMVAVLAAADPARGIPLVLHRGRAAALGALVPVGGARLLRRAQGRGRRQARGDALFHWSITYVSLLFVAVAVDPFLPF